MQYGYDFPPARIRIKQMEEAIQIIRLLWTQDDVTFKGKYHKVENAFCNPKPVEVPPVMIGGHGEKFLLKAVARHADWWNGFCIDVETWSHKLEVLSGHCDEVGRGYNDILKSLGSAHTLRSFFSIKSRMLWRRRRGLLIPGCSAR